MMRFEMMIQIDVAYMLIDRQMYIVQEHDEEL